MIRGALTARAGGILLAVLLAAGCEEPKPPARNQIPRIKEAVFRLQERVKAQDRAAIDSVLSAKILDNDQSSDSLLAFVYGPNYDFRFEQFGSCAIVYTNENAEANCYIMDSSHTTERPIRLSFTKTDSLWLLSSFGPGIPDSADTAQ